MSIRIALVAILAGVAAGCSSPPSAEVSGRVTLHNKPLAGVQVRFVPVDNVNLGTLVATTDGEGKFAIARDVADQPVRPGKYGVTVSKTSEAPAADGGMSTVKDELPEVTRELQRTPLMADVKAGKNELEPFAFGASPSGPR